MAEDRDSQFRSGKSEGLNASKSSINLRDAFYGANLTAHSTGLAIR